MNKIVFIALLSVFGMGNENIHTKFSCEFYSYANKDGIQATQKPLAFILITNDNNGTFTMKGNNGTSSGTTIRGNKGLSFIEITKTGNITTTTMAVVSPYANKQVATHSRNMLVNGKLLASQYYGTCQLVRGSRTKKVKFNITTELKFKVYKELKIEKRLKKLSLLDKKYILQTLEGTMPSRDEIKKYMTIKGALLCSEILVVVLGNYSQTDRKKFDSLYDSIDEIMDTLNKKSRPPSKYEKTLKILRKKMDIDKKLKEVTTYDKQAIKNMLNGVQEGRKSFEKMSKKGKKLVVEIGAILLPKGKK